MTELKTKEAIDMLGKMLEEKYRERGFKYSKVDRILSKKSKNFDYHVTMHSAGAPKKGVEINLFGGINIYSINSNSFPYSTEIQTDPKHISYNIATEVLIQTACTEICKKLDNGLIKLMELLEANPAALVGVMADKGLTDYDAKYCADIAYVMHYGTKEQAVKAAQNYYNSLRNDQKKDFNGKYSLAIAGKDYGQLKSEDYGGFSNAIFEDVLKYDIPVKLQLDNLEDPKKKEYMEKVFSDFKLSEKVSQAIINKYRDRVGEDVIKIWEKYGFGSTFKGYLKIINPDNMQKLLEETYIMPFNEIPVFVSGMGDIIACDSRGNFVIVDYRHQRMKVIWVDKKIRWDCFFEDFYQKYWQWHPYFEAVEKFGEPGYDECFGYEPLLSLGGKESVDHLKKVKYQVHIALMGEVQGVLSQ